MHRILTRERRVAVLWLRAWRLLVPCLALITSVPTVCSGGTWATLHSWNRGASFCRHGIDHLLDVARIMWIKNLEEQLEFDREVIYATALLHDIGKDEQYESGISHDVASERVADAILGGMPDDVAFEPADAAAIKTAILGHRKLRVNSQPLERLLYAADKASRACFACPRAMLATGAMIKRTCRFACS